MKICSFLFLFIKHENLSQKKSTGLNIIPRLLLIVVNLALLVGCGIDTVETTATPTIKPYDALTTPSTETPTPPITPLANWINKVSDITWVAYSPPSANPNIGLEATADAVHQDLVVLRRAGFNGLVTYGSTGIMGREFPGLAQELGFEGIIMGIWDLSSQEEMNAAINASRNPIVLGFCGGNEGLDVRYEMTELSEAIQNLREVTGKPVTTTEQIEDYADEELLQLGDWIFPNVHPYFHNRLDPVEAVKWTIAAYDDLVQQTSLFILFKEVGLPTAGDSEAKLTETAQDQYYSELAKTSVKFVYFEAFDQPWKTNLSIEPHWGIFLSDRTPKLLGRRLMDLELPSDEAFYVYWDADYANNHFTPSGYMGDIGDILIDTAYASHSGATSLRIVYALQAIGPHECKTAPPCGWAGVYWQEPPNNWGETEAWKHDGFDLTGYTKLKFWVRAEELEGIACNISFFAGGIGGTYGDSLASSRADDVFLTSEWQEVLIDLRGADLTHIIGGFGWVATRDTNQWASLNSWPCTFYLDDIRYER